ncbi:unnamed protein product [Caenorhabditis brenneri]
MANSFPMLRLPLIVMEKTIRLMDVSDQYNMAAISKRGQKLVRLFLSRDTFKVVYCFLQTLSIHIRNRKTHGLLKISMENPTPEEYVDMESLERHIECLEKVFQPESTDLVFRTKRPPGLEARLIPVFEKYLVITKLIVYPLIDQPKTEPADELYLYILKKCCKISCLYINLETTADFKVPVSECSNFSCDTLSLDGAHWVTGDHFVNNFKNVKDIDICGHSVNPKEANKFIKSWISGCRIESASWYCFETGTRLRYVFRSIDAIEIREVYFDPTSVTRFEEGKAFVVKQPDGKEAIVYESRNQLHLDTKFTRVSE